MTHKYLYRVAVVFASVLIALFIGEVGLRIIDKPKPALSGWRSAGVSPSERNQLGFRGQAIQYADGDFVVVLLGDSQVEAAACACDWMPERVLERDLNAAGPRTRVFSVAASGYGQDQQLLALREYLSQYRADLVILWETPANDYWNNLFPANFADGRPKPTFWLEGGELRGPSEGLGEPDSDAPRLKLRLLWDRVAGSSRDRAWERRYPPPYRPEEGHAPDASDDWQRLWDGNVRGFRGEDLGSEKSHLAMFLTPRSERTRYGLDLAHALLDEIGREVRSRGGRFAAFTAQTPPAPEDDFYEGVHALNGRTYRTSWRQYYDNVEYMNRGVDFRLIPVTVERWRVGPENPHLNEHATEQVMNDLAARIKPLIQAGR